MNHPNPFAPPEAPVADVGADIDGDRWRIWRWTLGTLVGLQFLATLLYSGAYYELTKTGAVSAISFLGLIIGACVYTELRW